MKGKMTNLTFDLVSYLIAGIASFTAFAFLVGFLLCGAALCVLGWKFLLDMIAL